MIVAADTGGTFTDLVAYDTARGELKFRKSLTTYDDLPTGVMNCVEAAAIDLRDADLVKFGTTLVINTFLQRTGARTALVTTAGFRDILEIRRGNRTKPFDVRYRRDPELVPRQFRYELAERTAADGTVTAPLDERATAALAKKIERDGIEALAVSFINSYANPENERRAVQILRDLLPGVFVTSGTELSGEWQEYERTSTAAANAYVGPPLERYVAALETRLRENGLRNRFFLMGSNGGILSAQRALAQPVMLVESGPVGGCIGAGVYARELGIRKAVAFDMGGTTAKCALLDDGHFEVKSPYYVGGADYGFPVRGNVLDIVEVGTGGGSIAFRDGGGRLQVGPRSAGSTPGPVCYLRGGTSPTITDANLVLGRIGPDSFLGGELRLGLEAARDAIGKLAEELGMRGEKAIDELAAGILVLGTLTMAGAIREVSVGRGLDPRDFALFAFGGGGPLHSATLARELSIPEVIVLPEPGVFSALGMILTDPRSDTTQTFLKPLADDSATEMTRRFEELERRVSSEMAAEIGGATLSFFRQAEMRFRGQRHSMLTPIRNASTPAQIRKVFEETYSQRFGRVESNAPIEFVSLVLTGVAETSRPSLSAFSPARHAMATPVCRQRSVYHEEVASRCETPVYQRVDLPSGFSIAGPAVIEEYGSTTVIGPHDSLTVGTLGELRVRIGAPSTARDME